MSEAQRAEQVQQAEQETWDVSVSIISQNIWKTSENPMKGIFTSQI